jgi:ADP-ribose pyrophosphatase
MAKIYTPEYNHSDVELVSSSTLPGNFFKLTQHKTRFRRYAGDMSTIIERELLTPPFEAAGMLLYDPKRQEIALTEQFRVGAMANDTSPWVVEVVMGMVDKSEESYQAAASREAFEEAGATPQRVVKICNYYPSPGISTEHVHLFCGEVDTSELGGVFGVAEENEDIKVVIMSVDEAAKAIYDGSICNATTLISVQWLLLNRATLWCDAHSE